jgi:hypothetical protein
LILFSNLHRNILLLLLLFDTFGDILSIIFGIDDDDDDDDDSDNDDSDDDNDRDDSDDDNNNNNNNEEIRLLYQNF